MSDEDAFALGAEIKALRADADRDAAEVARLQAALDETVGVLAHIRSSVRKDPALGLVVCIHHGSATMARIDAALSAHMR